MFERYTEKARRVIFFARYEASQFGSPEITTEYLILGLIREAPSWVKLMAPDLTPDAARHEIQKQSNAGKFIPTSTDMPLSQSAKRVLAYAAEEAERIGHKHIGCEHLLLALGRGEETLAAQLLHLHGFDITKAREGASHGIPGDTDREGLPGHVVSRDEASWASSFYWEKHTCAPKDALRHRRTNRISLYRGQPFDSAQFDLINGGWIYYRCVICSRDLYAPDDPARSIGYTNGQDWLCSSCHEKFAAPGGITQ